MRKRRREAGQALFEFGVMLPFLLALILGVVEFGYTLFQTQVITNLGREGSNLISRNTTIADAETALTAAATTGPVRLGTTGKVIFSVITLGSGGSNANQPIILQRHSTGGLTAQSKLGNPAQTAYGASPDYRANDANNDASIRVTGALPNGLTLAAGDIVYVTEVFSTRTQIVPFLPLPSTLYSAAYF
jgi:Flp pilus assembly protein TadG